MTSVHKVRPNLHPIPCRNLLYIIFYMACCMCQLSPLENVALFGLYRPYDMAQKPGFLRRIWIVICSYVYSDAQNFKNVCSSAKSCDFLEYEYVFWL